MGLDMFLEARHKITNRAEEAAYWRKANAVHKWFVDNVQNGEDECRPHYVEREQLEELIDDCMLVIAAQDQELSEQVVPTASGFFFGYTEYNDTYYDDLKQTIEMLERVLKKYSEDYQFIYQSSW
jgi:hypothetical protein